MNPSEQGNIEPTDMSRRQRSNSQHYRMADPSSTELQLQRQPNMGQASTVARRGSYDASMPHNPYNIHSHQYDITDPMHGIHHPALRGPSHIQSPGTPQSPLELSSTHSTPPPQTAMPMAPYAAVYGASYDPKNVAYFQPHGFAGRNDTGMYHSYYGQYPTMTGSHPGYDTHVLQGRQQMPNSPQPHHMHPQRLSLYDSSDMSYTTNQSPNQPSNSSGSASPFMASRSSSRGNERSYPPAKREHDRSFDSPADSELDNQAFDAPPAKRPKVQQGPEERESRQEQLIRAKTSENEDADGEDAGSGNESGGGEDAHDDRLESRPQRLVDISPYLNLPQKEAAKRLGLPVSTLSKRWKDATHDRKWPYRTIAKIDKEVMAILGTVPEGGRLGEEESVSVRNLLRQRMECLAPVHLRI